MSMLLRAGLTYDRLWKPRRQPFLGAGSETHDPPRVAPNPRGDGPAKRGADQAAEECLIPRAASWSVLTGRQRIILPEGGHVEAEGRPGNGWARSRCRPM